MCKNFRKKAVTLLLLTKFIENANKKYIEKNQLKILCVTKQKTKIKF